MNVFKKKKVRLLVKIIFDNPKDFNVWVVGVWSQKNQEKEMKQV